MSLVSRFLAHAPDGTARVLAALARAESLTDKVASEIYERVPIPGLDAADFVAVFKYSGLTEPRNSEWNLIPSVREELIERVKLARGAEISIHDYLLLLGQVEENRAKAGSEIPSYLFTEAGKAYHLAGAGKISEALHHYSNASRGPFSGAQWLAAKLATEQEKTKVIPEGEVETTFLRAWVMMREGNRQDAMQLFRKVAATDRVMREVAISLHILGNENNRGQRRDAERELRRSIEINGKLGNNFGVAQALHSLANLLRRQEGRLKEAEDALNESIELRKKLGDEHGLAQTLHSLANLLSRQEGRLEEAEKAYRDSIELGTKIGHEHHVTQTLHSLANLLSRQEGRFGEAEGYFKDAISILENLRDDNGVAQTVRSYGLAVAPRSHDEALSLLQRSLDINQRRGNTRFVRTLERDIRDLNARFETKGQFGTEGGEGQA